MLRKIISAVLLLVGAYFNVTEIYSAYHFPDKHGIIAEKFQDSWGHWCDVRLEDGTGRYTRQNLTASEYYRAKVGDTILVADYKVVVVNVVFCFMFFDFILFLIIFALWQ